MQRDQIYLGPPRDAADIEAIRGLCWDYRDFLIHHGQREREIVDAFYPEAEYARTMAGIQELHAPPDGGLFIAALGDKPWGCGMFHRFTDDACEWKRVFVAPAARGTGLGRRMCEALLRASRDAGYERVLLDTTKGLLGAQALYLALGFVARDAYYPVPAEAKGKLCFFEKGLNA